MYVPVQYVVRRDASMRGKGAHTGTQLRVCAFFSLLKLILWCVFFMFCVRCVGLLGSPLEIRLEGSRRGRPQIVMGALGKKQQTKTHKQHI